jgi:hypothetical protein
MKMPGGITPHHFLSLPPLSFLPREFLTGFHKRKVAKADAAKKRAAERERQLRLEARRQVSFRHTFRPLLSLSAAKTTAAAARSGKCCTG